MRSENQPITQHCILFFAPRTGDTNVELVVSITVLNYLLSASVECTFFQPEYTCTIDYGTDPSYTNLVYRDTTFTRNNTATITLTQQLRRDTTYYFIVSAESSSQCVRVRGSFQTGMNKLKNGKLANLSSVILHTHSSVH